MTHSRSEENIQALVLGALDGPEADELLRHAADCESCRAEIAAYRRTADALNLGVEETDLPLGYTSRLLHGAGVPLATTSRRPARPLLPWLAAAACLMLALALGAWAWRLDSTLSAHRRENAAVAQLMAEPGTTEILLTSDTSAAHGRLYVSTDRRRGVLVFGDLPQLPRGREYQIWLNAPSGRVSAGTFTPQPGGDASVYLQPSRSLGEYMTIGITAEPAGGSDGPTSPRVAGGRF